MTNTTNHPAGKYAPINGINLYYEVHGTGNPLIMLHGGFETFERFAALSPALATNFQVIGVDLYGHGVLPWDMVDKSISHHSTSFRLFFVSGPSEQATLSWSEAPCECFCGHLHLYPRDMTPQ
jgi:pimeloyl-ACP methyl ester carboxylesterase